MKKRLSAIAAIFVAAALAVACGESDTAITLKVKSKIATDRSITNASRIEVSTQNKVVTLTGTAETPEAKERAVALARGTDGAVDVSDNLTLAPGAAPPGGIGEKVSDTAGHVAQAVDDTAITTAVKARLLADSQVSGTKIDVDTKEGIVTLKGTVQDEREKQKAIEIARETRGVQRVDDQLMVRSS